jgi:hypothetical protein
VTVEVVDPDQLLRRVAAHGLPGQPGEPMIAQAPDAVVWDRLLHLIRSQRLEGFLLAAVDDGALPVTDGQRAEAATMHLDACLRVLRLEQRLLEVTRVLEVAGIETVVLKGSAHAHLVYPDPAVRSFVDLDLLVRSEQLEQALAVLRSATDATRLVPEFRRGYDRRYQKSVTLRTADGIELDVHRNLLFGTLAFSIPLDELFDGSVTFEVGGRELRALRLDHRILHACYHTGFGDEIPRFGSARDLAQMLTGPHDAEVLLATARRWRSEVALLRGVDLCRRMLGVDLTGTITDAIADHELTPAEDRAIECYAGADRHHTDKVLASLPFIDGPLAKARFLLHSAVPSREFATHRQATRTWLQRGWRTLQRRLRRRVRTGRR